MAEPARLQTPDLPSWPRGMSVDLAAAYVGISPSTWRREVAAGRAPAAVHITPGRLVWIREDLDRWLDRLRGADAASTTANPWDAM